MASIFTRIVRGELPSHKVCEDAAHLALMNINAIQPGHVLVIPKEEVDYLFDMDADAYAALWAFARRVEAALRAATHCQRVVVVVAGYEVPHVHIHLIPTNVLDDYPVPPQTQPTPAELAETAARIANEISAG